MELPQELDPRSEDADATGPSSEAGGDRDVVRVTAKATAAAIAVGAIGFGLWGCEHHASTPDPSGERGYRDQRGDRSAGEDRVDHGDRARREAVAFAVEAIKRARQRRERHHDEEGEGDGAKA
jgi:hypothetical protein